MHQPQPLRTITGSIWQQTSLTMLSCNWTADLKMMFLCATKDFQWFLLFCWLLTLLGRIMLGNFVTIITDKISLIMQVYQQSFCCGKECGRGKRIEEKTSWQYRCHPRTNWQGCLCEYIYYTSNPDNHSYFIGMLWKVHLNPPKIQWSRIDWMD